MGEAANAPLALHVPTDILEEIARRAAALLAARPPQACEGWLTPAGAATYLGVSRKRIHDLTSARTLLPDGRDGRTPLYTRATLDAYARAQA